MNNPLVSILIPVYKRCDLAIEAIDCAIRQDYPNIEIIVGDNCSDDGTYEILQNKYQKQANIIMFQNERNLGAVGNWERCLDRAGGKYIKFLWSDDLMKDDCISRMVKQMEENPDAVFAYSSVRIFEKTEELISPPVNSDIRYRTFPRTGRYEKEDFIKNLYQLVYAVPVSPGCAIFRKDCLFIIKEIPNKIGYVHRNNGAGIDMMIFLEAFKGGDSFIYMNEPVNYFREHPQSISIADKTILDGYWTAKQFYLQENGLEQYWKALNTEMISRINHKKIFSKKKNTETLAKYLDASDPFLSKHSVLSIIRYKLITFIYLRKINKK